MNEVEQGFYLYIKELRENGTLSEEQAQKMKDIFKEEQRELRRNVEREMSDSRWF